MIQYICLLLGHVTWADWLLTEIPCSWSGTSWLGCSAFRDEKGVYPVKLEVKEFKKNTNKLYLSVVLTKKESRYLSGNLGQDQLNTAPPTLETLLLRKMHCLFLYVRNDQ